MSSVIKNHLTVTKKDGDGIVVLVTINVLILAAPYLIQSWAKLGKDSTINSKDPDNAIALAERSKK
jgi:hypothetical protein